MNDEITDLRTALAERDAELTQERAKHIESKDAYHATKAEITTLRTAAQQALEACQESTLYQGIAPMLDCINKAITALTAALESKT